MDIASFYFIKISPLKESSFDTWEYKDEMAFE